MPETINLQGVGLAGVPHLDQYFGVWAMEADRFGAMLNGLSRMDLAGHIAQRLPLQAVAGGGSGRGGAGYEMIGGMEGVMNGKTGEGLRGALTRFMFRDSGPSGQSLTMASRAPESR